MTDQISADDAAKLADIYYRKEKEARESVRENDTRFAYYTSAEVAKSILEKSELWLRNASIMNDFSEISYGLGLMERTFQGKVGEGFRKVVMAIFPDAFEEVWELVTGWRSNWKLDTYIACLSVHRQSEDEHGRLSMWRAYGNTALVMKNTPFIAETDDLGVFSTPVQYLSIGKFEATITDLAGRIAREREFVKTMGRQVFVNSLFQFFLMTAIATKHPGFAEEREWRIFLQPENQTMSRNPNISRRTVVIDGVIQDIWVIKLTNDPANGLFGASVPDLLDRVIIGPSNYPAVAYRAFVDILTKAAVPDPEKRVFASDIPLRTTR